MKKIAFSLLPIFCLTLTPIIASCATNKLAIIDFQLETPSDGYTNTISHQCELNYHTNAKKEWYVFSDANNTNDLITNGQIAINKNSGLLYIYPGIPHPTTDNPYHFHISIYLYTNNHFRESATLNKLFNVSSYSKPKWSGSKPNRSLIEGDGTKFANSNKTMKIADISHLQPDIDWDTVKKYSDLDGAILRCAHGTHMHDKNFVMNVANLNRLNIPYGVYIYSSAASKEDGIAEANMCDELIKLAHATPQLPIFFDVEQWTTIPDTEGATCPTDSSTWAQIWNGFFNRMIALGYNQKDIYIYSYPSWANQVCQDPSMYTKLRWCARWKDTFDWNNFIDNDEQKINTNDGQIVGWQYSESEIIPGIYSNVTVDCSGFANIDNRF